MLPSLADVMEVELGREHALQHRDIKHVALCGVIRSNGVPACAFSVNVACKSTCTCVSSLTSGQPELHCKSHLNCTTSSYCDLSIPWLSKRWTKSAFKNSIRPCPCHPAKVIVLLHYKAALVYKKLEYIYCTSALQAPASEMLC